MALQHLEKIPGAIGAIGSRPHMDTTTGTHDKLFEQSLKKNPRSKLLEGGIIATSPE